MARGGGMAALGGLLAPAGYPRPIVDHALAREKTLQRYAVVKKQSPA